MFNFLRTLLFRLNALKRVTLNGRSSFFFSWNVEIISEKNSEIILNNAQVRIGYDLLNTPSFATFEKSKIYLGRGSKLIINGPLMIAPGATIRLKERAVLEFGGNNHVAHNLTIICSKKVKISEDTAISWNVTLIDDDEHFFETTRGHTIKGKNRPLILERNVGLQMNVSIPRGLTVGENSVVSCNTVLRNDVPANSLVYQDSPLRIRHGIHSPLPTTSNEPS